MALFAGHGAKVGAGVAEVASIGGFVQTYQVTVDPVKLRSYGIPLMKVAQVIRDSNRDVGGRVVEMAETEYMVRGKGYLRGKNDLETLVVKSDKGTPVLIRDIAHVELTPDERRGLTELNGEGEVVSGIAMARSPRANSHHNFFKRRIPCALTQAINRALDLTGASQHCSQRVGYRKPKVVVAMHRPHHPSGFQVSSSSARQFARLFLPNSRREWRFRLGERCCRLQGSSRDCPGRLDSFAYLISFHVPSAWYCDLFPLLSVPISW